MIQANQSPTRRSISPLFSPLNKTEITENNDNDHDDDEDGINSFLLITNESKTFRAIFDSYISKIPQKPGLIISMQLKPTLDVPLSPSNRGSDVMSISTPVANRTSSPSPFKTTKSFKSIQSRTNSATKYQKTIKVKETHDNGMNFDGFLQFTKDFEIYPQLITKFELKTLWTQSVVDSNSVDSINQVLNFSKVNSIVLHIDYQFIHAVYLCSFLVS